MRASKGSGESLSPQQMSQLAEFAAGFTHDPVGFVWAAFPWGEPGSLADQQPDPWQLSLLEDVGRGLRSPQQVIQEAVASGHGIGKSALVCWLIIWAMSTFEDCKGVVTANTQNQLLSKTWPELAKWHRLSITRPLFTYTATSFFSVDPEHEKTWRMDALPWSAQNPEAFAGLHNQGKRILVIFDEASAIDSAIWEVVEGALTDSKTEIIWTAFGNPTRNSGRFYDCFHKFRSIWHTRQIDSRDVAISNKAQLQRWIEQYGEDTDIIRVRVKGQFPQMGDAQLISVEDAQGALDRYKAMDPEAFKDLPVIFGIDPAWEGDDLLVCSMRQGNYSKVLFTMPKNDDDFRTAGKIVALAQEHNMAHGFIDMGYGTGIYSCIKHLGWGDRFTLVSFAEKPDDTYYLNKRAEMWSKLKQWVHEGGAIESQDIYNDLIGPEAFINNSGRFQLESKKDMKERGLQSPNYGDALALTFAAPVSTGQFTRFNSLRKSGRIRKFGSM